MVLETKLLSPEEINTAAILLQQGECVAFPTETVYGLGANAYNETAINNVFLAKDRPGDNPLIVHIYDRKQIADLAATVPPAAVTLMDAFWPGPLSLVLPKSSRVPLAVTAGLNTVAIRMPDHPLALQLLELADLPIAAPSANLSGRPSPTRAEHVYEDLNGRIAAILDGGATGWGVESTVVDCTCEPLRLLRPGGITFEQLEAVVPITVDPGVYHMVEGVPRSPGMKYTHYSPQADVILVVGEQIPDKILELSQLDKYRDLKLGVLATSENLDAYAHLTVLDLGSRQDLKTVASRIFHLLRQADQLQLDLVFVEGFAEMEMGLAIMNRLKKAAGYRIVNS